jgi:hypothetical protein
MASSESHLPPADLFRSQIPVSTQVYRASAFHEQYTDLNSLRLPASEEFFSLTNADPFQSYGLGQYDPSCNFLLFVPPTSTASGSLEHWHGVEPYPGHSLAGWQWPGDPNTQYFIPGPQPIQSYASSFPASGNSDNDSDIYPEFIGSPHLTTSTPSSNDGTLEPFPNYDLNYYI